MVTQAAERFGRYELVEKLGQGGMAEVWKAKIRGFGNFERTVVIKRILPQFAREEELVAMFMREAQLCSMLSHANIVQVHELGELNGEYYIAMEYVHGKDVHAIVNARPKEPLPPGTACVIARDVCRALAYAYAVADERGKPLRVIHRDVTPSNIMLTVDGVVKLVDFGVAKALSKASSSQTAVGSIRGKLGYAAPEQLRGEKVDHRTDLFAVGVVVHELLTGRRLFHGDDERETIENVLGGPIYPPSRINPSVPAALDALVLRALDRDPALRFQSGDEMADAFEPFVHQLAWGPAKVTQLLCARFPELDPALRVPANEFTDDDAQTTLVPQQSLSDTAPHVTLRPTASFVRVADDMGSWATPASTPNPLVDDVGTSPTPAFTPKQPTYDSGPDTTPRRAIKKPAAEEAKAKQTMPARPVRAPVPDEPKGKSTIPARPAMVAQPPRRDERPTNPARLQRPVVPATPLADVPAGSSALPKQPPPPRQHAPLYAVAGALVLVACALVYSSSARHAAPAPPPPAVVVPTPPPPPEPVAAEPPPAEPPPAEPPATDLPLVPTPASTPVRASGKKPAHAKGATPSEDLSTLPRSSAPTDSSSDFDRQPIFTGKPEATRPQR